MKDEIKIKSTGLGLFRYSGFLILSLIFKHDFVKNELLRSFSVYQLDMIKLLLPSKLSNCMYKDKGATVLEHLK